MIIYPTLQDNYEQSTSPFEMLDVLDYEANHLEGGE
jgi:hypothetical protein